MNGNLDIPGRTDGRFIPPPSNPINPPSELQKRAAETASGMFKPMMPPPRPAPPPQGAPPIEPKPQEQITMGQLNSTPEYVTKFLIDLVRKTLNLGGGMENEIPSGPQGGGGSPGGGPPGGVPPSGGPSHGYNIGEAGPEMVTAPGAYFPSAPGQVIPMEGRAEGGKVWPDTGRPAVPLFSRQEGGDVWPSPLGQSPMSSLIGSGSQDTTNYYPEPPASTPQWSSPRKADIHAQRLWGIKSPTQGELTYNKNRMSEGYGPSSIVPSAPYRMDASGRPQIPMFSREDGGNVIPSHYQDRISDEMATRHFLPGISNTLEGQRIMRERSIPTTGGRPIDMTPDKTGTYTATGGGTIPQGGKAAPWTGPSPFRRTQPPATSTDTNVPSPSPGYTSYGEGMDYKLGSELPAWDRNVAGTTLVNQLGRERQEATRLPQRSYYEAHPEEARAQEIYDINRPSPDQLREEQSRLSTLIDKAGDYNTPWRTRQIYGQMAQEIIKGRQDRETQMREIPGRTYGEALQYAPGSPKADLERAQAQHLRDVIPSQMAQTQIHWNTYMEGIKERQAERREEAAVRGETAKAQREERLYERILSSNSYTDFQTQQKTYNWDNINTALRDAVRSKLLPSDYAEGLPPPKAKKPQGLPPGSKEGRYDVGGGDIWNWTKAKGWYQ